MPDGFSNAQVQAELDRVSGGEFRLADPDLDDDRFIDLPRIVVENADEEGPATLAYVENFSVLMERLASLPTRGTPLPRPIWGDDGEHIPDVRAITSAILPDDWEVVE